MPIVSEIEPGQRIANFLLTHQITVGRSEDPETGVTKFTFTQLRANSKGNLDLGVICYDGTKGSVLGYDPEELERRLRLLGFMINVTDPFSALLNERGNFSTSKVFEPVRAALAQIEAYSPNSATS